jgi:hypothetical protein
MLKDRYGLEVSTSSVEARDAYVDAIDRMLAADGHIEDVLSAAIAADPDFALAHAAQARQDQLVGRSKEARAAAETAVGLAEGATAREQRHVEIINLMVTGKVPQALDLTKEHLTDHPRDAFVLAPACGVFGAIGFSGRVGREAEHLAFLEPYATHYGDDWWFQMVHAFALLETGEWVRGRELAERSLELRPDCAHGAHTLTHALYEAGATDEALGFLNEWIPGSDRASLMHCHNWWHYSMLLMMTGQQEAADKAFAENCLPGSTDSPAINVFTDSASYLWCSELAGVPRNADYWQTVRGYYEEQFRRPIVFVDAHVSLPYVALGDGDQLDACITELEELGEAGRLPAEKTAAVLARAYGAFGAGEWGTVIELLEPELDQVVRIGGSRAQRDLQTNTLLAAYINDGRAEEAQAFIDGVADRQPVRAVAGLS